MLLSVFFMQKTFVTNLEKSIFFFFLVTNVQFELIYGPGDWGSVLGWVIPKTQKMVLDAALLNTQHHNVRIKGKVEQFKEWSSTHTYTLV